MPTLTQPQPTPTVADALDNFLESFRRRVDAGVRSAATLSMHAQHREMILAVLPSDARVDDFDAERLTLGDVSGGTKRKRMSTLFGALRLAQRRGELVALPPRPEIDHLYRPGKAHLQTFAHYRALCRELPLARAEWVAAAVYTGMHAGDINSWRAFVDVEPFAEAPWMVLRNTKNRQTEGLRVRMPRELARVLAERFERERVKRDEPAVQPWKNGTRGHQLADAAARAGADVEGRITATALRHTCGTWMVRRNGITVAAQKWMGHSSPAMMARVYAHALPLQLEDCSAELDSMEDAGAARRPPRKISRKRVGNPQPSMVDGSGAGAVSSSPGPEQRPRGTPRARQNRTSTGGPPLLADSSVPRDRVELSTHGFSVGSRAPSSVTEPRRAAGPLSGNREGPTDADERQRRASGAGGRGNRPLPHL